MRRALARLHYQHYHPDPDCIINDRPKGIVLLIDEIDKADADLPNSLLETLDMGQFRIPWINQTVGYKINDPDAIRPLVIITTNEDRQLPPAFVRRCLVLNLELPTRRKELINYLIQRGEQHFTDTHDTPFFDQVVMLEAAEQLYQDRQKAKELGVTPPGQAEYLDILRVLYKLTPSKDEQLEKLKQIKDFVLKKYPGMKQEDQPEDESLEENEP